MKPLFYLFLLCASRAYAFDGEQPLILIPAHSAQVVAQDYANLSFWLIAQQHLNQLSAGPGDYWFAKRVSPTQRQAWNIHLDAGHIEHLDVFLYGENGTYQHWSHDYASTSPYPFHHAFDVSPLDAGQYWLLARVSGRFFYQQPQLSFTPQATFRQQHYQYMIFALLCLGALLLLSVHHVFMGIIERRALFINSGLILSYLCLLVASKLRLEVLLFSTAWPLLYPCLCLLLPCLCLPLFYHYLQARHRNAAIWLILGLAMLALMLIGLSLLLWSSHVLLAVPWLLLSFAVVVASLIALMFRKHHPYARVFMSCYAFWLSAGLMLFSNLGQYMGLNSMLSNNLGLFLLCAGALVLSLGLNQGYRQWQHLSERLSQELANERNCARTDSLSGLPNRFAFDELLSNRSDTACTMALLETEDLAKINEQEGQEKGDEYLLLTVDTMKLVFKEQARLYRVAGNRFAVVSYHLNSQQMRNQLTLLDKVIRLNNANKSGVYHSYSHASERPLYRELFIQAQNKLDQVKRDKRKPCAVVSLHHRAT